MLELKVKMININLNAEHPILNDCRPIFEYSYFIDKIREYQKVGNSRDSSIAKAIQNCREVDIMTSFLSEHGSEVSNMLYTQFNMEDALEVRGEEKYEEGLEAGLEAGIKGLILDELENGLTKDQIVQKLIRIFQLSAEKAENYYEQFSSTPPVIE